MDMKSSLLRPLENSIPRSRWLLMSLLIAFGPLSAAHAIEADKKETKLLDECEKRLCQIILTKTPKRGMLKCELGKTWGEKKIKKGAKQKQIGWSFGDAQCRVNLRLNRRHIIGALTQRKFTLAVPLHTVNCDVETSEGVKPLRATLAPKLKFKDGKVYKVWVKLKDVKGPSGLSNLIWTTAKLEDSIGIFHGEIVDEINEFVHKKCDIRYGKKRNKRKKRKNRKGKKRVIKAEP